MLRSPCPKCGLFHGPKRVCSFDVLSEALVGVRLTAAEEKLIRWLAGWDETPVWAGLFARLAAAHRARTDDECADAVEAAALLLGRLYAGDDGFPASRLARHQHEIRSLSGRPDPATGEPLLPPTGGSRG
jgi:hypothetical protein